MQNNKFNIYQNAFWLFMVGNILGVFIEGFWCLFKYGHWETHVVTIFGPFCLLYGIGAALLYLVSVLLKKYNIKNIIFQFLIFAFTMDFVEYISGFILERALGMRAWNYSAQFLNVSGYISFQMTLVWGMFGLIFRYLILPLWEKFYKKIDVKPLKIITIVLTVLIALDLTFTALCINRWTERHRGLKPTNKVSVLIDKDYNDKFMQKRFVEWRFIKK